MSSWKKWGRSLAMAGALAAGTPANHEGSHQEVPTHSAEAPTKLDIAPFDEQKFEQEYLAHADKLQHEGEANLTKMASEGLLESKTVEDIKAAAHNLDQEGLTKILTEVKAKAEGASEKGPEHQNIFILVLSAISLLYFANMMYRCAKHNEPISFLKHHVPFLAGLGVACTQMPGEIVHGLLESGAAFVFIMGITRFSRGLVNKVDLNKLSDEEAKSVIFTLGTIFGPLLNTLTTASVLSPLAGRLKDEKDRYISTHFMVNTDGGVLAGGLPALVPFMKLGYVAGPLYQAGVMLPIMLFQKIYQYILWRPKILKHAGLIWDIIKGFRYKKELLGSAYVREVERKNVADIVEGLKEKLSTMREELGPDYKDLLDAIDAGEKNLEQDVTNGKGPLASPETPEVEDEIASSERDLTKATKAVKIEEYRNTSELKKELEGFLLDPEAQKAMGAISEVVMEALLDGHITRDEILLAKQTGNWDKLVEKVPKAAPLLKKWESVVDHKFHQLCKKMAASHGEAEIMRAFTVQAMSVPLLIPIVELILKKIPWLMEPFTGATTVFADNYAACATTWGVDPAKAIALSIALGGGSIYGHMGNISFLGKYANLGASLKYAKYLLPTVIFMLGYLNLGGYETPVQIAGQLAEKIQQLIAH